MNRVLPHGATPLALLLTGCLILGQFARADERPAATAVWKLSDNAFFLEHYSAPPRTGSPMDKADVAYSIAVQASATPEQIGHATSIAGFDVFTFTEVLGPEFNGKNYPDTAAFFQKLTRTANGPKNFLKDTYARLRPCDQHPDEIRKLVPYEQGYSHPSGHSTRSWLFALVLSELNPPYRHAFIRKAAAVGHSRVLGGMHYQSDVVLSRGLAEMLFEQLMKDETFQADFAALKKAEWSPPPGLPRLP